MQNDSLLQNFNKYSMLPLSKYLMTNGTLNEHYLMPFYTSHFPYDGQKGICYRKSYQNDKVCEYNFLAICRHLNFVKSQRIILWQLVNSKIATSKL